MVTDKDIAPKVNPTREELFWDRDRVAPEIEIERAINFGGFDFIEEVQQKYGMDKFKEVLMNNRSLSRKAVNYWCLQLKLDKTTTQAYQNTPIWSPFR